MPRRFFRKFAFKRHQVRDRWYFAPFDHLLHDQRLWSIRRRTVVPAFGLGLFIAFMPIVGHMVAGALAALVLRVNIPTAVLATFVNNPLTIGPMFFFSYRLGQFLIGAPPRPFHFELSMSWFFDTFVTIWQPLLLGAVLLGACASLAGYIALDLLWRASIADYLETRRRRKQANADQ